MKTYIKKIALLPLLVITGLAYASMSGNRIDNSTNKNMDTNGKKPLVSDVQQTPDLKFKDENGKTISLHSLKGKVVFINLWATWCPPCIREMPSIDALKKKFKGNNDIVFLMVDVDNKMEKSATFMQENGYDLPVYVPTSNIPSDYLGDAIPTTVILDKNGDMIARMEGGRDYTSPEIIKIINELVESN